MPDSNLNKQLMRDFEERFSRPPEAVAFAPGRVEILGNHTDYNDGFVLSAAIDMGTCFRLPGRRLVLPAGRRRCPGGIRV